MQVQIIKDFLAEFRELDITITNKYAQIDKDCYTRFFGDFTPLYNHAQKLKAEEAPYYNIFKIMNVGHLEARVHSPILANFLNPKGSHSQGKLFLIGFLQMIGITIQEPEISGVSVITELSDADAGRMDIVIDYYHHQTPKAIVIENKIYSGDGKEQLSRYYDYLKDTRKLNNEDFKLIYLNPWQSKPTNWSISEELYKKLIDEKVLIELGYHNHIYKWLLDTLAQVKARNVQVLIEQYLQIIKML